METEKAIKVLQNMCEQFRAGGEVYEETIERLIDSGADIDLIKDIGYTDGHLSHYACYEALMSGRTEEEVLEWLQVVNK